YSKTVDTIEKIDGVKYVRQDEGLASRLVSIRKVVGLTGFWLSIVLAVISLFIISNTIKLAMFSRKREINIMKFVGATDWFIRWPFIIEGLLIGLLAGVVALAAQYFVYQKFLSGIITVLNATKPLNYSGFLWFIVPGFLAGGVLVGVLGSVMSVRKYLKV
ncbi:MAG TPA: FtsX-like permease family protein, partial [Ruminiclostridium sp.]|nr:FtsX-like permease family protein [Ruminiclostridium sp.]